MYLVSLYFDKNSNQILSNYIQKIAKHSGNTFMIDHHVPPHITILAFETKEIDCVIDRMEELKNELDGGDIQFVSVSQLLPSVIAVCPYLNAYLFTLQSKIFNQLKDVKDIKFSSYYQPFQWFPHVTLAKTLNEVQMKEAFYCMQNTFVPFHAKITSIRISKVNPYQDIIRWEFK